MPLDDNQKSELRLWWSWLWDEDGKLDEDKVLAELSDYQFLMEQAGTVYCTLTNNMMSKTTYYARDVITQAESYTEQLLIDARNEAIDDVFARLRNGDSLDADALDDLESRMKNEH